MIRHPLAVGAVLAGLATTCGAAGAERLNVKTGLWEIDSTTRMSGIYPLTREMRALLTPAQIAKMQADMKVQSREPVRETTHECVSEKDVSQPFHSAEPKDCRQTFVSTSRTTQEVRLTCDGEHKGSGLFKVTAPTPETMTATLDVKYGDTADAFTIKGTFKGRWLAADCGGEADNSDFADDEDEVPADDPEEEEE